MRTLHSFYWLVTALVSCLASLAFAQSSQKLLHVSIDDKALIRTLTPGRWATVFRRSVTGQAGDVLVVHGLNQVTTEDTEVTFSGRILVNGVSISQESLQTGKQPDEIGGNHHLGIYAIGLHTLPSPETVTVEFQIKGDIIRAKRREIFVDPAPGNGISQGRLLIEHYAARGTYRMQEPTSFALASSGSSFCCTQATYSPILHGTLNIEPGDFVKLAGQVTAIHNSATRNENRFDGEQIATAFTFLGAGGPSGYIGENVTSRNAKFSVFNESIFLAQTAGSAFSLAVGANFGRGAYLDNAATNFSALKWSEHEATGLSLTSATQMTLQAQSLPVGTSLDLVSRATPLQSQQSVMRTSVLLSLRSDQTRASLCRFDLRDGLQSTTAYRSFGNGYRFNTVRLELDSPPPIRTRTSHGIRSNTVLSASCTGKVAILQGTLITLGYAP